MTEDTLNLMRLNPGLYVFGDTDMPGVNFPVAVIKPLPNKPGLIFALEPRYTVEACAEGFGPTTYLAGGPYTAAKIDQDAEKEAERLGVEAEADYFKDIALRAEAQIRFARTFQDPKSEGFAQATDLIERIEFYKESQARLNKETHPNTAQ